MTFLFLCVCLLPNCDFFSRFSSGEQTLTKSLRLFEAVRGSLLVRFLGNLTPHSLQRPYEHVWTPGPRTTFHPCCIPRPRETPPSTYHCLGQRWGFVGRKPKPTSGITLAWRGPWWGQAGSQYPCSPSPCPSPKPLQFISSTGGSGGVTHGENRCCSPSAGAW